MSKRFDGEKVWITGGSAGIGRAMAVEFASRGADVAVSARRVEKLQETVDEIEATGQRGLAVPCDVTDDAAVAEAVAAVVEAFGTLHVAVANAGFGVAGRIEDLSAEDWRRQFDVNVIGLASTIRWAMPHLRASGGRMVLIGSVAGMIAAPGQAPYHASKYAVRAIGQVLSMELADSDATCTTVHPGFVESEIAQVDNEGEFREEWEDRRPEQLIWPTDRAASKIIDAAYDRKREYTFTGHGKVGAFFGRHAPGLVHFAMTKFGSPG